MRTLLLLAWVTVGALALMGCGAAATATPVPKTPPAGAPAATTAAPAPAAPTAAPTPSTAPVAAPKLTPAPPNPPPATWTEIARWSGQSIKNTETFQVASKEWRISWDTQPGEHGPGIFQIYIYKADGTLDGVAANVIGANKDATVIRGAGQYYLSFNTSQPYTVTVEVKP